ncbi:MAG: methyltransferase domain-containing protein [Gemmatimonadetes bacterium]|nr:methyltransferase domain-containing protein [Gemmatimonadota bacterium]
MKTSPLEKVRELYEESADSYAEMMDSEIDLPVYSDILGRLAGRIVDIPGSVIDTSCGSGHILSRYRERYDSGRSLIGIDLSPRMVAISGEKLGSSARVLHGDMRCLEEVESDSAAGVLSFFAIHHIGPEEVLATLREWHRVLRSGGQLVVATWEGTGTIDYGEMSDVVALRYTQEEMRDWAQEAGFAVDRCVVEPVEEMPMEAVYLEGIKE